MMLKIGDKAFFSKTISECDVYGFAGITGDFNPIHIDEKYSGQNLFKKRIVHGMLGGSLFSAVIGTKMPGPGTIYLEQNVRFLKPVYIGDTVTAIVEVTECINSVKGIYKLTTTLVNQENEIVIVGWAIVKYISDGDKMNE